MGGWWRWALVSPAGVASSWMVSVSVSVNLPLHHKVQKFSSGTGSPGWCQKKDHKTVCGVQCLIIKTLMEKLQTYEHCAGTEKLLTICGTPTDDVLRTSCT